MKKKYIFICNILFIIMAFVGINNNVNASHKKNNYTLKESVHIINNKKYLGPNKYRHLIIKKNNKVICNVKSDMVSKKKIKNGWNISLVASVGGARYSFSVIRLNKNNIKVYVKSWESYSPKIYKHTYTYNIKK